MLPYNALLQAVDGKVYHLHDLWSNFHLHHSEEDGVEFYGVYCDKGQMVVFYKNGDRYIYSNVPADILKYLDAGESIYPLLTDLNGNKYEREPTDAFINEVPVKEVVEALCRMQDHITITNGLWATDEPDAFKDHPAHQLLWQIWYKQNDDKPSTYESRS